MNASRERKTVYAFTLLVVVGCALLLAFAMQRLAVTEKQISRSFGENILWALGQAQYENHRLALEAHAWNGGERAASDAEKVRLQLDLALSRLLIFQEGSLAHGMAAGATDGLVDTASANLAAFERAFEDAVRSRSPIPGGLVANLSADASAFRASANAIMLSERENLASQRDERSSLLVEAIVAVSLIFACGVFIVVRLVRSLRAAADAETALRRDRDFSRLLVEASGDGVLAFDTELRCTHWNSAMGAMFPLPGIEGVVGRPIQEAYSLGDDHTVMVMLRKTIAGESPTMPAHPLPGRDIYVEKLAYPIMSSGEVIGGILFIRDVTDNHRARLEILQHRDQLESVVQERTRDLEESLRRETDLRELYKGFVSMVSHQFRTPLSIIDSSAQRMIRRGKEMSEEEIQERAGKIRAAALRLTRLVSSTLNAARMDAGQIDVTIRSCDLGKLIVEACERQKEAAPDRQFDLRIDDLPPLVSCDPLLVDQIIANLLSNAVKYSAAPHPIEISAHADDAWVQLKVCDRGIGIPDEERPKLFERFFRATTSAGVEGTGIGLHVARTIARMHGGDVEAQPREGGGSSFVLAIPRNREEMAA